MAANPPNTLSYLKPTLPRPSFWSICLFSLPQGSRLKCTFCFCVFSYRKSGTVLHFRLQKDLTVKAWNHLKLQPFVTPDHFFPYITTTSNSQILLQTVHYLYNPDIDIYFKTIAMGQRKLSLGLGRIMVHYMAHALSAVKFRRRVVCVTLEQVVLAVVFWL